VARHEKQRSNGNQVAADPSADVTIDLAGYRERILALDNRGRRGVVRDAVGLAIEVAGLSGAVGELLNIETRSGTVPAEIIGFRGDRVIAFPLGECTGLAPGSRVVATGAPLTAPVGRALKGRVLDGLGRPIDGGPPVGGRRRTIGQGTTPHPLARAPIQAVFPTGVRAIDGLLTCGRGQRLGIFAGSGVGKSTMLGMIARHAQADVNVIALVGERGREVREFLDRDLGAEGLARSVVIVATSETPALVRIKACEVATAIAEAFRDQGDSVLLLLDSVTRLAMAQREVALAAGEPPALRGYPPSVFALLPRLLERAGCGEHGAITAFYTVLMEGDDLTEPVTDTVRGTLDGHIMLSRSLAAENRYPAIDILGSVSRVMSSIVTPEHAGAAARLRALMAAYSDARDLISVGAYLAGADAKVDAAVAALPALRSFLNQRPEEPVSFDDAVDGLRRIAATGAMAS
jgi:flagellum-specific ATP synthase